jgi:tRNA threonylcarbamoyladenosine biosynthesis protein TsaE
VRLTLRADSADATHALGAAIAPLLEPGDVVSLSGPLGAGKTRLVQGLAAGLGVQGRVTSPTFVLVRRHAGRLPLLHCDAYRLERTGDLAALDDDLLAPDVVTCVEWGDAVASALPDERLDVALAPLADLGGPWDAPAVPRDVALVGHGPSWDRRWRELSDALRRAVAP